jgi:crotonobetainyl-CoA:carnitine CoA-transferase CaiB-like acyl-CoA transferase
MGTAGMTLSGIRVLDLGQIYNGSYCGLLLGFLGAEVIKLEPPTGENLRKRTEGRQIDSYAFNLLNLNKKGITLNLKDSKGKEIFKELTKKADVLIENFATGVMDQLGLGYEVVHAINPRLIYASGKGFGSTGPYSNFLAMDLTVQAMSGLMSVTGFPDGPPTKCGPALADFMGGVTLLAGILAALYQREQTLNGQYVESSMHEAILPTLTSQLEGYFRLKGQAPERTGNRHGGLSTCPYNVYEAIDGHVAIICVNNNHWNSLCKIIGREELAKDEQYSTNLQRCAKIDFIDGEINKWTQTKGRFEIHKILNDAHVPCAPVMKLAEVVEDPHHLERGMLQDIEHPEKGRVRVFGNPIRLSENKSVKLTSAPLLGQDNAAVYQELLGIGAEQIKSLKEQKII